jgi:hypothetical protein
MTNSYYHRDAITRNRPSGKNLFPLRDLHALHGQFISFFGPLSENQPAQHFHHEVHEEKKKLTLNTITIGKQFINRIGRKATHPKTFTILSLRGAQATRQSNPNRSLHKHRPPPCTPCHCEPQSGAAIQRNLCVTRDYPHSPWIAASGLRETLLAMTNSYYHRDAITRNRPSGKNLFTLRDLHALHGQCFHSSDH